MDKFDVEFGLHRWLVKTRECFSGIDSFKLRRNNPFLAVSVLIFGGIEADIVLIGIAFEADSKSIVIVCLEFCTRW